MSLKKYEVPLDKLRCRCDESLFDFECTKDLAPLREFIGQERAVQAVEFGLNMTSSNYNIYVAGLTGTGKTSMVKAYIEKLITEKGARGETVLLDDWCYLYNFRELDRPWIVSLPQGKGNAFRTQVGDLLGRLREDLSQAFASEEYKNRRKKIVEAGRGEQQQFLEKISQEAHDRGFSLQMTQMGPMLVPLSNGHPMEDTEYHGLDEAKRREIEARRTELRQEIQAGIEQLTNVERETAERLQKVDKEIGQFTVSRLFAPLVKEHAGLAKVSQYLDDLKAYTLENLDLFKATEEPVNPVFGVPTSQMMGGRDPFLPFQVNVFIDNSETKGPPVIIESNPNFGNVFGKIERRFLLGGYLSDHTMLKPGALGRANGGYLLINAPDVLANPGVWPALKRAIKGNEVRIEDPFEQFGLIAPQGMRPEPMPIKVKIILIGDAYLYQMLSMYDEDFWEIFKVKADFNTEIERTRENMLGYAAFLSGCCEECQARHFDPGGVAKVMEYSSRMVADQERLSSRFAQIREVVEEANYWTAKEGARYIGARHVQQAIDQRRFRHNLVEERLQDGINRGMVMIDVGGAVVGQVNGLSVYSLGDFSFGKPSRITAQTFLGRGGVINIERESRLSGPIFNKGVLILSGYLGWKYAQDKPLSLSASLCFEQSYEGVEGDSASSPELYAILSSLSGVPVKQNIAVTGSVNQKGELQPIGGVNQKIEGFFRVCQARGLTGEQGVLIPHQNLRNLMLRDEVVEAVANGQFHIYSARTIDEGIEVLTGRSAGKHRQDGSYPRNTINFLVDKQLKEMADRLKGFYAEEKKGAK